MSENPPTLASTRTPPSIPKRPLTCYGIFSILERNLIWQQNEKQSTTTNDGDTGTSDPYAAAMPKQYRHLVLPPNWYMAGMNRKKRVNHKVHGKITFHEMTKSIAEKWRNVDAETRAYCEMIANEELERHKREVAEFKERYGEEAFKALSSSGKSKEKRKHEQSEDEVEESDSNVANNLNAQSDISGVTYPGEVRSSQPNETSITSQMMNNLNQQTNGTAFTNNLIPQLNNNISASFAAASLPNYEANPYASFSMPHLPSDRLNTMQTNNFTGQLNNVWTAYAAAAQQDFIRSKLIELQQQSQMSSGYLGATVQSSASQVGQGLLGSCSQHYGAAAASNQAVMPQSQDQKLPDDFPDDVSEDLGLAENSGDNSKDGAKVTSDGDEE